MTTTKQVSIHFGNRIKSLRRSHHLSQAGLSKRCGLSHSYISGLENGKHNPNLDTLVILARAFDLSLSELFADMPSNDPATPDAP